METELLTGVVTVSLNDALETARELGTRHGILTGISAGANTWAARQIARRVAAEHGSGIGHRVVTVIPSNGERYLSSILFEGQFDEIVAATA